MIKENFFVLTGAMGAGKSAVLEALAAMDFRCIAEPARIVLKEQRQQMGMGVPEKDPALFNMLMLKKMLGEYSANQHVSAPVIFDRGVPDLISYAELLGTGKEKFEEAAGECRYNSFVFLFNAWEEIYTTDDERKMSFGLAKEFGENVGDIYRKLGYVTIDVPFAPVQERADFVVEKIAGIK
ncbi:MAG: AAA family ATPase [Ignavibacteria bacterium]|nr:AAA family ATPase [Ignavibacteria bacterium]